MDLTLEAYRNIVKNVGSRSDIATLCGVSKGFRYIAERALYNTLFMRNDDETLLLCHTLINSLRLAEYVDALTISFSEDDSTEDSNSTDEGAYEPIQMNWLLVAQALKNTTRLRYLNVHISASEKAYSWIVDEATFQLRKFHCEFDWDHHLVAFLDRQTELEDLFIADYRDDEPDTDTHTPPPLTLAANSIPKLSILECTFSEAAMAIVPGRPVTHLKTCFSHDELSAKREEMYTLLSRIVLSTRPLRSLDIGDSLYTETFSTELLASIANTRSLIAELKHLGTLVLPIDGRERLQFYGLLMRFPSIQSVEFEVTEWDPPPSSPAALRALGGELRLYSPSVVRIIFVQDFERSVVAAVDGICRVDPEISTDLLWRER
ncbi:hypothetical protein BDN70DRAFT_863655 [Pholiota conissans]|uniref:Uncharacterized protein n=1 Tax=Pholiota conissans TaxID=109636 RepID=A0A9P5YV41_9AGAR|nr:hypothetical protein BDN70DRAFT_863655 [Pholiota conissans]